MAQSTKKTDAGRVPGPQAVPNVIEIKIQSPFAGGRSMFYSLHGAFTTAPSNMQTLANALFTSLSSAWNTNLASLMAPTTSVTNVYVRDMTSTTNPVFVGTGTAVVGTSASIAMPPGAAIVMTENINARGRGAKGRVYLGGWATNADASGGQIAAASQTAVNNFGTAVFNAISGQSLTPCVAQPHRQAYTGVTGTNHVDRPASHVAVTSYTCRDLAWDSQRRRAQP